MLFTKLLIYIFLVGTSGYSLLLLISPKNFRDFNFGLALPLGLFVNSLAYLGLLLMGVTNIVWLLVFDLLLILASSAWAYRKDGGILKNLLTGIEINPKIKLSDLVLGGIIFLLLLLLFYNALNSYLNLPDELSYWGRAVKEFYTSGIFNYYHAGFAGFEKYPLLLPLSATAILKVVGGFYENYIKVINPLLVTSSVIFIYHFFRKIKLERTESFLFIIFFLTAGRIFTLLASSFYADVAFAVFYGLAAGLFYLYELEKEKSFLILSGLMFAATTWIKIEGFIIALATILAFMAFEYFSGGRNRKKSIIQFGLYALLPMAAIVVVWQIAAKYLRLGASGWSEHLFANTSYVFAHLTTVFSAAFSKLFMLNFFTPFWIIAIAVTLAGLAIVPKRNYLIFIIPIIVNVGYLFASYLFVFSAAESIIAHSFERYILHILLVVVLLLGIIYGNLVDKWKKYFHAE